MSVDLTPTGTRGAEWYRNLPRPLKGLWNVVAKLLLPRMGLPVLNLTTVGARTGQQRTIPLAWFPDGPNAWLVVASFGGSSRHPAWYVNMAHHPDQVWIQLGSRRLRVRPETLKGEERADAFRRVVATASTYGGYQEKTDREIPVVRLTPAE